MAANPESQGASNVISHSKDEYFLNKCTDKSWFVVELCESIKALKVQLALLQEQVKAREKGAQHHGGRQKRSLMQNWKLP